MFEDSTFESTGRIHTRSRSWMIAALAFNGSILVALVLIPLIYPEALPRQANIFLMDAPPPQTPPKPEPQQTARVERAATEIHNGQIMAPPRIPDRIFMAEKPEPAVAARIAAMDPDSGPARPWDEVFRGQKPAPVVREQPKGPTAISRGVAEGLLMRRTMPSYPPIAIAARQEGTVVLQATISKTGTIENLRVVSGPAMLQQAAIDAVRNWRYRPYLLDGLPVEVETQVNVIFRMSR